MKGVLPRLVRLAHRTGRLKSCLGCSSRPSTKYIETCPDRSLAPAMLGKRGEGRACLYCGGNANGHAVLVALAGLLS